MKALRRTFTLIMILALCVTVLAGCKNNQIDPPAVSEPAGPAPEAPAGNPTDGSTDSETTDPNETSALKDLAFVYNGSTITLSEAADDAKLEGILGKAEEIKTHTYSEDDGLNMDPLIGFTEKQYEFPGLEIKTIKAPNETDFHIFSIEITDPKYPTSRNIKVGDSVEALMKAYPEGNMLGNSAAGEEDDFQYLPVDYVDAMKVHVKNGKVESIQINKLLD